MPVCGHLEKQGEKHKRWKRRWFLLNEGMLYYFSEVPEFVPVATISLNAAAVSKKDDLLLDIHTPNRVYHLRAMDKELWEEWLSALQDPSTVLTGFLDKQGAHNKVFRRRWFCLDRGTLSYFRSAPELTPVGAIDLYEVNAAPQLEVQADERSSRRYYFSVQTPGRCYSLSAPTAQEAHYWIKHISHARKQLRAWKTCASLDVTGDADKKGFPSGSHEGSSIQKLLKVKAKSSLL